MYYSLPCPACGRIFYLHSSHPETASEMLYDAIRKHLEEYNEDYREYDMDDGKKTDSKEIEGKMQVSEAPPKNGWYELP
jgi:hypothetical protein